MYKRLELHNHTNESDAVFTCKELTDFMVADQVDAFALTDHNTISGHCKIKNYLKEHPQPIAFIPGMEYTTYYGHPLSEPDRVCAVGKYQQTQAGTSLPCCP